MTYDDLPWLLIGAAIALIVGRVQAWRRRRSDIERVQENVNGKA